MANVTIDGIEVPFEPGESVIAVAARADIEIPYYCWHPRLSVAANCRMCMVEILGAPKLLPACQTECREGMSVRTTNERVQEAQRAVHEFLLVNHPIDCPICDQAGECKLQDYYMAYHKTPSRRQDEPVRKHKVEQIGPLVVYDAERCIVCTRCVRFMAEVVEDPQLGVFNRGDRSIIGVAKGHALDSAYSLNTVDVCPVGALTAVPFRFKQRVWNLQRGDSICGGCARGCNVHAEHRAGLVYRYLPRENDAVNQSWMCDDGRLSYQRVNTHRLQHALLRHEAELSVVSAKTALERLQKLLEPLVSTGAKMAMALSLHATCEEAYVFGRLAKDVFATNTVALLALPSWQGDKILRVSDQNPNRQGVMRVLDDLGLQTVSTADLLNVLRGGTVKGLLTMGHEGNDLKELASAALELDAFVHIGFARNPLTDAAHVTLPGLSSVQVDGTWLNIDHRAQRLRPVLQRGGEARAHHEWLLEIAALLAIHFTLPSMTTIRGEMQRRLPSFAAIDLNALGPKGQSMPSKSLSKASALAP